MSVEIKIIKPPQDYSSCLKIRAEVFIQEQNVSQEEEIDGKDDSAVHFLALLDGEELGTARVRIESNYYKIERVAVLKKARGKRVGFALMEAIESFRKQEYPQYDAYLSSQKEAIPFYEKLGYMTQGDFYLDANIEHKTMIKKG